jgi:hypothetical protein
MIKSVFKFYFWWFVVSAIVLKFADIKSGAVTLIKIGIIAAPFLTVVAFWFVLFICMPITLSDYIFRRINHLTHHHDGRL